VGTGDVPTLTRIGQGSRSALGRVRGAVLQADPQGRLEVAARFAGPFEAGAAG